MYRKNKNKNKFVFLDRIVSVRVLCWDGKHEALTLQQTFSILVLGKDVEEEWEDCGKQRLYIV